MHSCIQKTKKWTCEAMAISCVIIHEARRRIFCTQSRIDSLTCRSEKKFIRKCNLYWGGSNASRKSRWISTRVGERQLVYNEITKSPFFGSTNNPRKQEINLGHRSVINIYAIAISIALNQRFKGKRSGPSPEYVDLSILVAS